MDSTATTSRNRWVGACFSLHVRRAAARVDLQETKLPYNYTPPFNPRSLRVTHSCAYFLYCRILTHGWWHTDLLTRLLNIHYVNTACWFVDCLANVISYSLWISWISIFSQRRFWVDFVAFVDFDFLTDMKMKEMITASTGLRQCSNYRRTGIPLLRLWSAM